MAEGVKAPPELEALAAAGGGEKKTWLETWAENIVSSARSSRGTLFVQTKNGSVFALTKNPITGEWDTPLKLMAADPQGAANMEDAGVDPATGRNMIIPSAPRTGTEPLLKPEEKTFPFAWQAGFEERQQGELRKAERAWGERKEMEALKKTPVSWIEYETKKKALESEPAWAGTARTGFTEAGAETSVSAPPYGQQIPTTSELPDVPTWLEELTGQMPQVPTSWQFPTRGAGGGWSDLVPGGQVTFGGKSYPTAGLGPMRSELAPMVPHPASAQTWGRMTPTQQAMTKGYLDWARAEQERKNLPVTVPLWEDWAAQTQAGWPEGGAFPKGKKRAARQY